MKKEKLTQFFCRSRLAELLKVITCIGIVGECPLDAEVWYSNDQKITDVPTIITGLSATADGGVGLISVVGAMLSADVTGYIAHAIESHRDLYTALAQRPYCINTVSTDARAVLVDHTYGADHVQVLPRSGVRVWHIEEQFDYLYIIGIGTLDMIGRYEYTVGYLSEWLPEAAQHIPLPAA